MSMSFSVEKTVLVILTLKLTIFKAQFHIMKNVCETDIIIVNDYKTTKYIAIYYKKVMVHPVAITVFITRVYSHYLALIIKFCYNSSICILHIIISKGSIITTVESISQYFLEASAHHQGTKWCCNI